MIQARFVLARGELDPVRAAVRGGPNCHPLVAEAALDDVAGRRVHNEVVGVYRAGDHPLAQAGGGVDNGLAAPPRERVGGEEDACDRRPDHPLHGDGETDAAGVDPAPGAVAHRAVGPK